MHLEPFAGPDLKLKRARRHIEELRSTLENYSIEAAPHFVKTDRAVNPWQIQICRTVPTDIPVLVGDIAHCLRSSLDVMMVDIAIIRGVGTSDMKFPFAESEAEFLRRASASGPQSYAATKLGPDVMAMVEAAQPYKGSTNLIRGLHDLNNADKHRMTAPWVQFVSTTQSMGPMLQHHFAAKGKNITFVNIGGHLVGIEVEEPIRENTYITTPHDSIMINPKPMRVCFPRGFVIAGEILSVMQKLSNDVSQLVESFRAAVVRP